MEKVALSVKQLNLYVRSLIEGDVRLADVLVEGEISNFKNHYSSGHLYFTLKDNDASIRCVMFRSFASRIKFEVGDGVKVILRGKVSLYEKDGQYQFYAEEMMASGMGDIALQFEQIKKKLEGEGLFDSDNKRPIPEFPENIAVVTSKTGAAVRDILNILSRRWPLSRVILCPVSVQGELAVPEMIRALDELYSKSVADVIIIGRGGGSIEDLWAFNSEELARKIFESPVPVISAVGHETDFTICDFVADLRAPTPSAAAELAVPDKEEMLETLKNYELILKKDLVSKLEFNKQRLRTVLSAQSFKNPVDFIINRRFENLDRISDKLTAKAFEKTKNFENDLMAKALKLDALSPLKVLARGYSAVTIDNKIINSIDEVKSGDIVSLRFKNGKANAEIKDIEKGEYR